MPAITPTLRGDDEVDAIPPALLGGGSFGGALAVLFWMLATGRLVTRREHENRIADKDAQLAAMEAAHDKRVADKDTQIVMWRAVSETKDAQNSELLEHSRMSVQILQAIERRAQEQAAKQAGA